MLRKIGIFIFIIGCLAVVAGAFLLVMGCMSESGSVSGGIFLIVVGMLNVMSSKLLEKASRL